MKIKMITNDFPISCGGVGYYVYYLSRELIAMGHDVSVILRGKQDRSFHYNNIEVIEMGIPGRPPLNLSSFRKKVERILSEEGTDLVHIHNTAMPSISCGCPVIVTAHCCVKGIIKNYYRPIRDLDGLLRNLLFPYYSHIERKLLSSSDKFLVVSNSLRNEFKKYYNVNSDVMYNGVDTEKFNANNRVKEDLILFTGMFRFGKGLYDLLRVAEMLKRTYPEVQVVMVGDGPIKKKVHKIIQERDLFNVKTTKQLSHNELLEHYHRAKVYVLPSYYEGLPTTILEAMACKLPVVASNISGIPEQIEEGVTGYMLSPGDINGFYSRIVKLLEDPEKRKSFGEKGRERVMERFTWPHIAKGIAKKYTELLQTNTD